MQRLEYHLYPLEDCTDGEDNNNDAVVDCEDRDCVDQPPCVESMDMGLADAGVDMEAPNATPVDTGIPDTARDSGVNMGTEVGTDMPATDAGAMPTPGPQESGCAGCVTTHRGVRGVPLAGALLLVLLAGLTSARRRVQHGVVRET